METTEKTCKVVKLEGSAWRPRRVACGKPLKTDEQIEAEKCGAHLGAAKRKVTAEQQRSDREAQRKANYAEAQRVAEALREKTGLRSIIGMPSHGSQFRIQMDVAEAARLLASLR
jgi:hypothetical protein